MEVEEEGVDDDGETRSRDATCASSTWRARLTTSRTPLVAKTESVDAPSAELGCANDADDTDAADADADDTERAAASSLPSLASKAQ